MTINERMAIRERQIREQMYKRVGRNQLKQYYMHFLILAYNMFDDPELGSSVMPGSVNGNEFITFAVYKKKGMDKQRSITVREDSYACIVRDEFNSIIKFIKDNQYASTRNSQENLPATVGNK